MRLVCFLLTISLTSSSAAFAQEKQSTDSHEAYLRTINGRAQKIVSTLNVKDSATFYRVQALIANQYNQLSELHGSRDEAIKTIKSSTTEKPAQETAIKQIQDVAAEKINLLHKQFLKGLSGDLSDEQIVKVKDGLTYNVVNVTYTGYNDMIPTLTTAQKQQIRTWLEEARESAMDAESSEKKHAWFGKYKGRINNYLSAAGYDLQKERKDWEARIKARGEQSKNSQSN